MGSIKEGSSRLWAVTWISRRRSEEIQVRRRGLDIMYHDPKYPEKCIRNTMLICVQGMEYPNQVESEMRTPY